MSDMSDSPTDYLLLKLHLRIPFISFTLVNSRETGTNAMMQPHRFRRGRSQKGSSAASSSRHRFGSPPTFGGDYSNYSGYSYSGILPFFHVL